MNYSASRRPTLLAGAAQILRHLFTFALLIPMEVITIREAAELNSRLLILAGQAGLIAAMIAIHELGHLAVGYLAGEPVKKIRVGSGWTVLGGRIGSLQVQLCLNPLGGGAVYFGSVGRPPVPQRVATLAAAPLLNLLVAVLAGAWYATAGGDWVAAFGLANGIGFLNLLPVTVKAGNRLQASDGMQILDLLGRGPGPSVDFEGGHLSADARDALMRAADDARIAGAAEISDEDILRGLRQDAGLGALLGQAGVNVAPRRVAIDSDLSRPALSSQARAALEAGLHAARDLGLQRANAAALCLGLLAIDCPSGALLKQAGVDGEGLRRLAMQPAENPEDRLREKVISADLPLERWGTAADRILAYAFREAEREGAEAVGTHHLLAALVADPDTRAARALARIGFGLQVTPQVRAEPAVPFRRTLTPQTGLALAGALWRTGTSSYAGTGELLLGLVDHPSGVAAQLLHSAGVNQGSVWKALRSTSPEPSGPAGCTPFARQMWSLRAGARLGAARFLEARADFQEALQAADTPLLKAMSQNNIAWASLMADEPGLRAEALELATAAYSFNPSQPAYAGTYAHALLANGDPARARELLDRVIPTQARPRDRALNLCLLAMCQAQLGQPEEARQSLARATELNPDCQLFERAAGSLRREVEPAAGV